jgi:prepilin-type N-terminal cleavage/methylation domain-containing protein/prepilin-type processing-associated H-X9-DG protein
MAARSGISARGAGFTLVELLVVIGIIALLIGILLPALRKAQMAARTVACMSNMKQISNAMMMWANDHKGFMPASGGFSAYRWDPVSNSVKQALGTDTSPERKDNVADWIAWSRRKDQFNGVTANVSDHNITYSALAAYLGAKRLDHKNDDQANTIGPGLDKVYRCPEDNIEQRNSFGDDSHGYYRYSYAMNSLYASSTKLTPPAPRFDGAFNGRISSIHKPGEKVLLVCEDERTLDNGEFSPSAQRFKDGTTTDLVASRHELRKRKTSDIHYNPAQGNEDAKGNVGFCDGHVEFFGRKDALRGRYSGSPVPDPVPF